MFERYTEKARRTIFFARYEASVAGHKQIETTDLLAGLLREWRDLATKLNLTPEQLRGKEEPRERLPTSIEMPFSEKVKDALLRGAEYASRAGSPWVDMQHLLVGLAQADSDVADRLQQAKVNPEDLASPEKHPKEVPPGFQHRVGIGFDYHRLEAGRKLILGGVEIPFSKGLVGHSDGDVLTHAVCDALLGAAGLGDIGQHFPDTDPKWKGVSSLELLARVHGMVLERGWRVVHVDSVVMAQEPKLAPYFPPMRAMLAQVLLNIQVNVKAKTTEGLEAVGRGEAMAAQAVALLEHR